MKRRLQPFVVAIVVALASPAALAGPAPLRHLVYKFSVGISFSQTVHDSGFSADAGGGSGAGVSDSTSSSADEGQIIVDVTGVSADGGVVVSVSEIARNARSSQATTCVVYGSNLALICDPGGKVNDEEFSIVRFIGKNFVAPGSAAGSHWQVSDDLPAGSETNTFTVTGMKNGVLTINEDRVQKVAGAHPFEQTTNGTIAYNTVYTVPTTVHEIGIKRQNQGAQDYVTTRSFTDLSLVSDSLGGKQ